MDKSNWTNLAAPPPKAAPSNVNAWTNRRGLYVSIPKALIEDTRIEVGSRYTVAAECSRRPYRLRVAASEAGPFEFKPAGFGSLKLHLGDLPVLEPGKRRKAACVWQQVGSSSPVLEITLPAWPEVEPLDAR